MARRRPSLDTMVRDLPRDAMVPPAPVAKAVASSPASSGRGWEGMRARLDAAAGQAPQSMEKTMSVAPLMLLRMMQKNAGIGSVPPGVGSALFGLAKRNPGLLAGTAGGALFGGIHGSQGGIDPATGQPVGGGVTGALSGAMSGGLLGGGLGLGAQGALRSGLKAREITQMAATKGRPVQGGFLGALTRQAGLRASNFAGDVGRVANQASTTLRDATRTHVAAMPGVAVSASPAAAAGV